MAKLLAPLADALTLAKAAAFAADIDTEDGGTSNFDQPALRLEGWRDSTVQKVARATGVDLTPFQWFGKRWYWVGTPLHGQGNRRTRMAEAATKALKDAGLKAQTYYQMD